VTNKPTKLLEGAYDLQSAQDNIAYYKDFAAQYDAGFADALGYNSPTALAEVFQELSTEKDTPIADIGCGTGLVAQALGLPEKIMDGYDISAEMLDKARVKKLYRTLYLANLKQSLKAYPNNYGALISAGTFTLGHLGPADLENLLGLLQKGGLVCVTVSTKHYNEQGFAKFMDKLHHMGKITCPEIHKISIYNGKKPHGHASDTMQILCFRKTL